MVSIWNRLPSLMKPDIWTAGFHPYDWKIEMGARSRRDIPVRPVKSWRRLPCCMNQSCSFAKIRPDAKTTHVTIPGSAGITTRTTVSQRNPRARPASRWVWRNVFQTIFYITHHLGQVKDCSKAKAPEMIENPYSNWTSQDQVTKETHHH